MKAYDKPEVIELGEAGALTFGGGPSSSVDGCDCAKRIDDPDRNP